MNTHLRIRVRYKQMSDLDLFSKVTFKARTLMLQMDESLTRAKPRQDMGDLDSIPEVIRPLTQVLLFT